MKKLLKWIGLLLVGLVVLGGIIEATKPPEQKAADQAARDEQASKDQVQPAASATAPLAPEMVVQLSAPKHFACLSEGHLHQAVEHAALGERTKFEGMFSGGACIVIPAEDGARFKVLSIRRNAVEFTGMDKPRASDGLWAVPSAFRPV